MIAALSSNDSSTESFMRGLKFGGLMNRALEQDDTFRKGRHHFMTAVNQILEWSLALEQIGRCFQAANMNLSLANWHIIKFVVPMGTAYLASRQIRMLHLSEIANFVQTHLGKLSLVAIAISSIALLALGQTVLAVTTLAYLSLGLLDRYNLLSESTQKVVQKANFFIGNFTGLYLGGNFVRLVCAMNLTIATVEKYFENREQVEKSEGFSALEEETFDNEYKSEKAEITLSELELLTNEIKCSVNKAHIQIKPLPEVREDVRIEDLLEVCDTIDWSKHEYVVKNKLKKDKRWLEVGQFNSEPLDYFKRNLRHLIDSIKDHTIMEGKPASYEMLELYCRYIAQEMHAMIEKEDMTKEERVQAEMAVADMFIKLGVEGADYCGTGKFGAVEEVYENLVAQSNVLPLETRVLACQQQERQRIWQHIYQVLWTTNPLTQIFGYFTDVNAIHNANVFINLIQAGHKFGIPHEAAKNDQAATINPITHYLAFSYVHILENCFWKGNPIPQYYLALERPEGSDWWKAWKWVHLKTEEAKIKPYEQETMLERLIETIGLPQMPITDVYEWWQKWIDRQDLQDDEKQKLIGELYGCPEEVDGKLILKFNNEVFSVDNKIEKKFLIAMMIEMGFFVKPSLDNGFGIKSEDDLKTA